MRCARGPRLLPVEHPATALVVALGPRTQRGEVGTSLRFGPGLRPDPFAGRHRREPAVLLLLGAVLEDRGGEQEDAVLAHPRRCARAVVLLLEDHPLDERCAAPVVLLGPADHRPAGLGEPRLPLLVGAETLG